MVAKSDKRGGGDAVTVVATVGAATVGLMTLTVPAVGFVTIIVAAPILVTGIGGANTGVIAKGKEGRRAGE